MKFSYAAALSLVLGLAIGAPAEVQERDVSNAPINLEHGPDNDLYYRCGKNFYSGHDIYLSIQHGINLKIAGETRGRNQYPHPFDNNDSKGNLLTFPANCPPDTSRYEYPLKVPYYDAGPNNVNQGDERVVYYWLPGDIDYEGNPNVQFCGIMTHDGAPPGGFLLCP